MHTTSSTILLAACVLLANAAAQATPQALPDAAQQRLAQLDANGDHAIDRTEAQAMPRLAEQFEQLDGNRDGRLTMTEVEQSMQTRWAAADANHDGYIDKAEVQHAAMPRLERFFERLDANADGRLSQQEVQKFAARMGMRGSGRALR